MVNYWKLAAWIVACFFFLYLALFKVPDEALQLRLLPFQVIAAILASVCFGVVAWATLRD